jgi:UDP-N-acetylglucosamine--dolichyl-phosphate N-acetylglucosaminephosphotransferase
VEIVALSALIGFLAVLAGTPYASRYLLSSGIFAVDQQKEDKPKLPTSGGVSVLMGFVISVTVFLGISSVLNEPLRYAEILAALSSVTIITLIGLIDDIHIKIEAIVREELEIDDQDFTLEIHRELEETPPPHHRFLPDSWFSRESPDEPNMVREGLGQVTKMLFVLPAVFPLMAVGAGSETMAFPVIGTINWGYIYPLVLLPLGLLFVSNVVNMLEGMNGLGAANSLIASAALGTFALVNGQVEAAVIAFSLTGVLLGFLKYNWYPATILPGDSLTYLCGAAMFASIVIGDMEKFGVFIFTPWIAEFVLKARSGFKAHSWGELQDEGTLEPQHEETFSLTHPLMRRGLTEREIATALAGLQLVVSVTGLLLFTFPL